MSQATETTQVCAPYPTATGSVPIGTILPYGGLVSGNSQGTLENQGYLFCDGTAQSRSEYSELFSVIGNMFGSGDNVNTFNLPNLQGVFLRGVDNGTGQDPDAASRTASALGGNTGDNVGSSQSYEIQSHAHDYLAPNDLQAAGAYQKNGQNVVMAVVVVPSGNTGGNETRPTNVYVNYIIKAKNVS